MVTSSYKYLGWLCLLTLPMQAVEASTVPAQEEEVPSMVQPDEEIVQPDEEERKNQAEEEKPFPPRPKTHIAPAKKLVAVAALVAILVLWWGTTKAISKTTTKPLDEQGSSRIKKQSTTSPTTSVENKLQAIMPQEQEDDPVKLHFEQYLRKGNIPKAGAAYTVLESHTDTHKESLIYCAGKTEKHVQVPRDLREMIFQYAAPDPFCLEMQYQGGLLQIANSSEGGLVLAQKVIHCLHPTQEDKKDAMLLALLNEVLAHNIALWYPLLGCLLCGKGQHGQGNLFWKALSFIFSSSFWGRERQPTIGDVTILPDFVNLKHLLRQAIEMPNMDLLQNLQWSNFHTNPLSLLVDIELIRTPFSPHLVTTIIPKVEQDQWQGYVRILSSVLLAMQSQEEQTFAKRIIDSTPVEVLRKKCEIPFS